MKCLNCGKEFITNKYVKNRKKFCSDKCCWNYHNKKRKRLNDERFCIVCNNKLKGLQKYYCCSTCKSLDFQRKNKEKLREIKNKRQREYAKRNPHIRRNDYYKRKEYLNTAGKLSKEVYNKIMSSSKYCTYCKIELDFSKENYNSPNAATIDHIIPLSKGGTNDYDNLCLACRSCNSSKGAKKFESFLKQEISKLK